jgi:hypothetical protein
MPSDEPQSRSLAARLGWFVLLYCGSAVAFALAVYGFRALIPR